MQSVTVIGASGLIGSALLRLLSEPGSPQVHALLRRPLTSGTLGPNIHPHVMDLGEPQQRKPALKSKVLVSALGTTIKTAGSQEEFWAIDHDLVLDIARQAQGLGLKHLILVSAMGADPNSRVFYSRVKGLLEVDLEALGLPQLSILRPSLLLGARGEFRLGERIAASIMGPLRPLIPANYRPIRDLEVAQRIIQLMSSTEPGVRIYAGQDLFPSP